MVNTWSETPPTSYRCGLLVSIAAGACPDVLIPNIGTQAGTASDTLTGW